MTAEGDPGGGLSARPGLGDTRPAAKRVARNSVLRAGVEILGKLAALVLFAYIARKLGRVTLGDFVFALSLAQIVYSVAGFGMDRMALRDISRDRHAIDRLLWDMAAIKALVAVVGVGICTLAVATLGVSNQATALVAILGASILASLLLGGPVSVFQAFERMEYYAMVALPVKVLNSAFGIIVLVAGGGIIAVALSQLVVAAAGMLASVALMYRHFAKPRVRVRPAGWPALARDAAPFGLQEILGQILFRVNTVLLAIFTSAAVVGAFGAGFRLLEATMFLAWSVGTSVLPMYSYLERGGSPSLEQVHEGALKLIVVLLLPISVGMFVCARALVDAVFGLPEFESTVAVVRVLSFACLAYAVGHLAGILVLVRRPGRLTVITTAVVTALNLALNLILIPLFEATGAAVASLASEVSLAAAGLYLARTVVGRPRFLRIAGAATVAGAAMAAAMIPIADRLELALPAGAAVYCVVFVVLEARSLSSDLSAARLILRRGSGAPLP